MSYEKRDNTGEFVPGQMVNYVRTVIVDEETETTAYVPVELLRLELVRPVTSHPDRRRARERGRPGQAGWICRVLGREDFIPESMISATPEGARRLARQLNETRIALLRERAAQLNSHIDAILRLS